MPRDVPTPKSKTIYRASPLLAAARTPLLAAASLLLLLPAHLFSASSTAAAGLPLLLLLAHLFSASSTAAAGHPLLLPAVLCCCSKLTEKQAGMDSSNFLVVRFHYNGVFTGHGPKVHYVFGREEISHVGLRTLSLSMLLLNLEVHYNMARGGGISMLHWLSPGKELSNGLLALVDDSVVHRMAKSVKDGGLEPADIYVEDFITNEHEVCENEDEVPAASEEKAKEIDGFEGSGESESDSDFVPSDCSTSDDDVEEIKKNYKEFKRNRKKSPEVKSCIDSQPKIKIEADSSGEDDESYDEDSDGNIVIHESEFPRYDSDEEVKVFSLGMQFSGKKDFKEAVIEYGMKVRKEIRFLKDEGDMVRAKCTWPTCKWVCLCRKTTKFESWQITSFIDEHTCPKRRDSRLVTSRRIAERFESLIKSSPEWPLQALKSAVQEEMFANVSMSKIKRAKAIVTNRMLESKHGEYGQVFDYQLELLRSNPGSTCVVKLNPENVVPTFDKFYICFDACKKGFLAGCRKVIGLDGSFLKGRGGELLSAIGRDANHQMYPIAWALVDKETNVTWDWFVSLLVNDLKLGDGTNYVVISDQQKGIINAVEHWLPQAEHRNYARHLYANWRKTYREKKWQKLFWACAKASSPMLFNLARAKLSQATRDGARDVMKLDPHHWSRAWFRLGSNCDSVDSNICESFNKWIVEPRCHPVISCFEAIRKKVYARIEKQRTDSQNWTGIICPTVMRKLKKSINISAYCHPAWNGQDSYEVTHREHRFKVSLVDWTCSCRYWQLSGLPCPHAISCIYCVTNNIEEYIHKCYSIEEFKKTYAYCLQPVEGRPAWPVSGRPRPEPPGEIAMPGRKKKARTREDQEKPRVVTRVSRVGTKIKCGVCKQLGHNRTSCNKRHGIGSSTTPTPAMEGQGPTRSKATSARSKGKSPMEGQGPARSKTPSGRSKAPSASHGLYV